MFILQVQVVSPTGFMQALKNLEILSYVFLQPERSVQMRRGLELMHAVLRFYVIMEYQARIPAHN